LLADLPLQLVLVVDIKLDQVVKVVQVEVQFFQQSLRLAAVVVREQVTLWLVVQAVVVTDKTVPQEPQEILLLFLQRKVLLVVRVLVILPLKVGVVVVAVVRVQ
jgi:hypothetical protein